MISRFLAAIFLLLITGMAQDRGLRVVELPKPPAGPQGKFYALLFATNEYAEWPALQNPIFDAEAVERKLREQFGFETNLIRNPSKADISKALGDLKARAFNPNDELLVFAAGHGTYDEIENTGYLVARDSRRQDPLHDSYLSETQLLNVLSGIRCRHVLVVLDACYSGAIAMRGGDPKNDIMYASGGKLQALLRKRDLRSLLFLTSGGKQYVPDGRPGSHSPFAFQFLRALESGMNDPEGIVTFFDIVSYADHVQGAPQPRYGWFPGADAASDFWLIAKPENRKLASFAAAASPSPASPPDEPPQVRPAMRSDDEGMARAREELRSQGIGMDIAGVKNALLSADVATLRLLTAAAVRPALFEEALRQKAGDGDGSAARRFFEASLNAPDAIAWLDDELAKGLNPNLTLTGSYYPKEGLLHEALRASNAAAMKTLLKHGAGPHAYQDLFLTPYANARFLFPLRFVADDDKMTLPEKQDLVKAFLQAGAVVPKPIAPRGGMGWPPVMFEANNLQEDAAQKLGMKLTPTATLCEQPATAICRSASERTKEDWCSLVAAVPKKLNFVYGKNSPLYDLTLPYLLGIDQNRMYFLGLQVNSVDTDYLLVEVSKDGSSWNVLRFIPPGSGMGLCRKDPDGFQPQNCWRKVTLRRMPGTDEMHFDDWGLTWKIAKDACAPAVAAAH